MIERYLNAIKDRVYKGDKLNAHRFYKATGKKLNLKNPQTWSEKLFWLNKYWQPEIKAICADKYKVREYIESKGFGDTLVGLIGHWKDARDIDFSKLPNKFVLKCNHGCRMNILVEDKSKLDIPATIETLNNWMSTDHGNVATEYQYHFIDRYIICEEYLPVDHPSEIVDFKIHCFNGEIKWIGLCYDRDYTTGYPQEMIMSPDWERLMYLKKDRPDDGKHMDRPGGLDKMKQMAIELSKDFHYVRVDLYYIKGQIYFGELTFTPNGCLPAGEYVPEVDVNAGKYLNLDNVKKIIRK